MAPKISVVLATARSDFPLRHDPTWHIFGGPAACLRTQTFTDFEWIVVDVGIASRSMWFAENPQPFNVRHVPIKSNPWTPTQRAALSASRNTGITYAQGELIVFFDDAWTFPPNWLERHWSWYERGFCTASLYKAARTPNDTPIENDGRFSFLDADGTRVHRYDDGLGMPPAYGGIGVSREAIYGVGGYEELIDSGWGLEDIELGYRLHAAGYKVVLDRDLWIVAHPNLDYPIETMRNRKNYTLCCENIVRRKIARIMLGDYVANSAAWTVEERSWFVPKCKYLADDASCKVYGPHHPCSRSEAVRVPDTRDPLVAIALESLPRGLRDA